MNEVIEGLASEVVTVVAGAVALYLAALARKYVNKSLARMDGVMDEEARRRLEAAFERAIAAAEREVGGVDLDAVEDYLRRFNPGDLARFDLRGAKLRERLKAQMTAHPGL